MVLAEVGAWVLGVIGVFVLFAAAAAGAALGWNKMKHSRWVR